MKNLTYILAGISGVVIILMTASWAQNPPPAAATRVAPTATPVAPAVAPKAVPAAVPPVATAPVTAAPKPAPVTATPVAAPKTQPTGLGAGEVGMASTETVVAEMKQSVENNFASALSFPLTEEKMLAFVRAAIKVEKTNSKWDVQIASAETDQMAIEYSNFAVEEINTTLKTLSGITFPEYQEMTKLTVDNKEFNKIYLTYKQLVQQKYFDVPAAKPVAVPSAVIPVNPVATPTAPVSAIKPPAAPVNSGTVPAPLGSPTPPYSKP